MTTSLIILILLIGLVAWAITIYNKLVRNKNLVKEGWSGIDVQLKQRANLIPNVIETVKGYASHEKGIFEEVAKLRSQCLGTDDVKKRGQSEGLLSAALGKLFAVAENYPELKASQNFMELQQTLRDVEDKIQLARRYYNGTVRDYNIMVESVPSNIIAGVFNFKAADYFEIENPSDREVPQVKF